MSCAHSTWFPSAPRRWRRAWGPSDECSAGRPPFVARRHRARAGAGGRYSHAPPGARDRLGGGRSVRSAGHARPRRAPSHPGRVEALAARAARAGDLARDGFVPPRSAPRILWGDPRFAGAGEGRVDRPRRAGTAPWSRSLQHPRAACHPAARCASSRRARAAPHRSLPAACRGCARLHASRAAAISHRAAGAVAAGQRARSAVRGIRARHEPPRQAVAGTQLAGTAGGLCPCRPGDCLTVGQRGRARAQRTAGGPAICRRRATAPDIASTRRTAGSGNARSRRRHGACAPGRRAWHANGFAVRCYRSGTGRRSARQCQCPRSRRRGNDPHAGRSGERRDHASPARAAPLRIVGSAHAMSTSANGA